MDDATFCPVRVDGGEAPGAARLHRHAARRGLVLASAGVLIAVLLLALAPAGQAGSAASPGAWPAAPASRQAPAAAPAIAFVRGHDIWRISPDGSGARRLTSGTAMDGTPAWSPDHATVAFVRARAEGRLPSIHTVSAAGGAATLLYRDRVPNAVFTSITGLAYDPLGGRLAFADISSTGGDRPLRARVVAVDLTSGAATVLLRRANGFGRALPTAWRLSWSPDGATLLVSQSGQDEEGGQTWRFRIADGALTRLPVADASNADWSADGASLLVSTSTQKKTSIKRVRLDGSVIRTLATGGGWRGRPSVAGARFAPGGGRVVYGVGRNAVWLMDADGSAKHRLTAGSEPAWR